MTHMQPAMLTLLLTLVKYLPTTTQLGLMSTCIKITVKAYCTYFTPLANTRHTFCVGQPTITPHPRASTRLVPRNTTFAAYATFVITGTVPCHLAFHQRIVHFWALLLISPVNRKVLPSRHSRPQHSLWTVFPAGMYSCSVVYRLHAPVRNGWVHDGNYNGRATKFYRTKNLQLLRLHLTTYDSRQKQVCPQSPDCYNYHCSQIPRQLTTFLSLPSLTTFTG